MTDREMLEMAAKAAGHKIYKNESKRDGILIFKEGRRQFLEEDGSPISSWNPLTDDGDALRLAVKLGMSISIDMVYGWTRISECEDSESIVTVTHDEDVDPAATRRAITEYAARVGRAMK